MGNLPSKSAHREGGCSQCVCGRERVCVYVYLRGRGDLGPTVTRGAEKQTDFLAESAGECASSTTYMQVSVRGRIFGDTKRLISKYFL